MYPESDLELMVLQQIEEVKRDHACWEDPERLSRALNIKLVVSPLGALPRRCIAHNVIAVDPFAGGVSRRRFTFYHEIVHQLIKRNDVLFSILHDQYRADTDFERICERLCDVGAAEFLIPRTRVRQRSTNEVFRCICFQHYMPKRLHLEQRSVCNLFFALCIVASR